jgi:hypothetical protein
MIFITLWMVSQLIIIGLVCIPIDAFWDITIPGKCLPMGTKAQMLMASVGNIITDVIILLLPVPVVLRLKLRKQQKVALLGIFSLGFLYVSRICSTMNWTSGLFTTTTKHVY